MEARLKQNIIWAFSFNFPEGFRHVRIDWPVGEIDIGFYKEPFLNFNVI